jgi:CCR4-NOT transcription complex subunit 4
MSTAQLLAEIKATAPADVQKCLDSLFRSASSSHYKPTQNILPKDLTNPAMWEHNVELNLTKAEVEALLKGTSPSLHYGGHGGRIWDRGMVTSTGAHLRALTKELEMRFLELEKMLKEMPEASKFHPSKPQNEMKFPHIDLEALRRQFENQTCGRGLSVMEQMVQDGSMTKKGAFLVDEASKYINEFVMPPATPPPSAGGGGGGSYGGVGSGMAGVGAAKAQTSVQEMQVPSVDIAERQLNEAKRVADERDAALKKAIKKNKKILGLG